MKKLIKGTALAVCALSVSMSAMAGNKDRIGQAGATELSINPWAKSTGVFGMNTAYVGGLDALKTNVAGLALVDKMEVAVAHTRYLRSEEHRVGKECRSGREHTDSKRKKKTYGQ